MSITQFRTAEPLYIVIVRNNNQAESQLKAWIKEHRVDHATVSGNRMMLHHQQAFDRFLISWTHNWDAVTVWDTWNRRHIYI
jgi:hypothetical protein